ncbi:related to protein TOL [Cephalotrichum gorgonifer]|uniref:Related to protein TOL n=1 Tax=Cephalotrichum gorgonifer TaxID=2041049 RepID=A0AAE8N7B6_9PEZI|nr:related to protein TOL [Cephalotrichum gorgonifer]
MDPLIINLKAPTAPQTDSYREIDKDPASCDSCLKLNPASAQAVLMEQGVHVGENLGEHETGTAAEAGQSTESSDPENKLDFAPYEVETYLTDIQSTADTGCETCAMIRDVLTRFGRGKVSFSDPCQAANIIFCRGVTLKVYVSRVAPEEEDSGSDDGFFFPSEGGRRAVGTFIETIGVFELYTLPGQRSPWQSIGSQMTEHQPQSVRASLPGGQAAHVPPVADAKPCFDMIRGWLRTCLETHEACRQVRSSHPLPKRVISVGDHSNTSIRLVETEVSGPGVPTTTSYLALSHCWGLSVHLTTTKSTLADRKSNIPWDSLPPTFQDAVSIARKLGYASIWIDSLCIIQDDAQDWVNEAAKMASIYEGAALVLAATSAVDGDGGCLAARDQYLEIKGTSYDGEAYSMFARKKKAHLVFNGNMKEENLSESWGKSVYDEYPLFTRAWCFQERLLATRMLHFTKDEMVFDCLEGIECECGRFRGFTADFLRRSRQVAKLGVPVGQDFFGWSQRNALGQTADGFQTWRNLVVQYSLKDITRRTDRLPGISGIASIWPGDEKGLYLAGIWTGDVVNSLLWEANSPNLPSDAAEYIGPSWSWVSSKRGVNWTVLDSSRSPESFITVDDSRSGCLLDTTDPFGMVKSAWLAVKGRVVRLKVKSLALENAFVEKNGDTGSFVQDDAGACEGLVGTEVLAMRVRPRRPIVHDLGLVLAPPDNDVIKRLPEDIRKHPHVYRRIGLMKMYHAEEWSHDTESEELDMYLI